MKPAFLPLTLGTLLMATAAPAQPDPKSRFTEKVTFRYWSEEHKIFRDSAPLGVDARRILDKNTGQVIRFAVSSRGRPTSGLTPPRSEIVDADGVTWVVTKATSANVGDVCDVVKKPTQKAKGTKKS